MMAAKKKPVATRPRSDKSENQIVKLIDSRERTTRETAVDPVTSYNPWNPDELYQKYGSYHAYEEMLKDDQVSVALQVKKDLILGSGFEIDCADAAIRKDIEKALCEDLEVSFDDALGEIITAYEYGFSVTEKQFKTRDDGSLTLKCLKTRSPISWLFHQDEYGNIIRYEQMGADKKFKNIDPNAILHFINNPRFGNPYGTSDLRSAYAAFFIKKQIIRFYAIFLEKAASPTPVARYNKNIATQADIDAIHNAIKKIQTSTAITVPSEFELEFMETKGNHGETYIRGISLFNMFIGRSLLVPDLLGFQGNETTGGSQSLGREQMQVFFKHIARRRRTLEAVINEQIIKPLVIWNHGEVDDFPKFKLRSIEDDVSEKNARLWLEAVRGKLWEPNLAEINRFKSLCEFPETTEEEFKDVLDARAREVEMAEVSLETAKNPPENVKDQKTTGSEGGKRAQSGQGKKKDYALKTVVKTDFEALEKFLDRSLAKILKAGSPLIKEIADAFAEEINQKGEDARISDRTLLALSSLIDDSMLKAYDEAKDLAATEIGRESFALTPEEEAFLKILKEENYNFIRDWEYRVSKDARIAILAAIKEDRPISSVVQAIRQGIVDDVGLERYARTKFTEVMNKARLAYFDASGVVHGYEFSAIMDGRTSEICRGLHGRRFISGTEPTPPLHFSCRSALIPILIDEAIVPDKKIGKEPIGKFIERTRGKGF